MKPPYHLAQSAIADLKAAVHTVLSGAPATGLTNAEIGRTLGIYRGHVGHEGHISRTLLDMLQSEGLAEQDLETKRWRIRPGFDSRYSQPATGGERDDEQIIDDADRLTAADVAHRRVRCPACREMVFERWPEGWDAHAAHRCAGLSGDDPAERKVEFRRRFSHLFR